MRVLITKCCCLFFMPMAVCIGSVGHALAAPPQAVCDQILRQYDVVGVGCPVVASLGQPTAEVVPHSTARRLADRQRESNVFFPAGGSQIDERAQIQLAQIARILEIPVMQAACLKLVGHSDSVGTAAANQRLSMRRARAVADLLASLLADPDRIREVKGLGEKEPLPGFSPQAVENRRVEVWVRSCP